MRNDFQVLIYAGIVILFLVVLVLVPAVYISQRNLKKNLENNNKLKSDYKIDSIVSNLFIFCVSLFIFIIGLISFFKKICSIFIDINNYKFFSLIINISYSHIFIILLFGIILMIYSYKNAIKMIGNRKILFLLVAEFIISCLVQWFLIYK